MEARYTKDGKDYISVTQLLDIFFPFNKKAFESWCKRNKLDPDKIMRDSSRMGSKVSEWIENYVLDIQAIDSPTTIDNERGLREAVNEFLESYEVVKAEESVFCEEYEYAGTFDMLVAGLGLCDAKTYGAWKDSDYKRDPNKIKKAQWQLSMYAYAEEEVDIPLNVVIFKTDGTFEVEEVEYTDEWKDKLVEYKDQISLFKEK